MAGARGLDAAGERGRFGEADGQDVAERVQYPPELRGSGLQRGEFRVGQQMLQLAAIARDFWNQAKEPAECAGQAGLRTRRCWGRIVALDCFAALAMTGAAASR